MKITPAAGPVIAQPSTGASVSPTARAKAIAMISQAQETPVSNPSNVSVEELSAIQSSPQDSQENQQVEETQQEAQVETKPEPTKEEIALSRQFAQLARQEKALRAKQQQQEQAIKAREAALAKQESELQAKYSIDSTKYIPRDMLKQQTLQALAEAGVSYDELTQQILNQQPSNPQVDATISRLEAKIKALEEQTQNSQKQAEQQQQESYKAALRQIELDTRQLVSQDPAFETIKETNSVRDVVELIERTYNEQGKLLSVEDAAQKVEDYLVEEALKLTRIGKIKTRLEQPKATAAPIVKQAAGQPANKQTATMKTLTNSASTTRKLSSRERALLAFKGELNQ